METDTCTQLCHEWTILTVHGKHIEEYERNVSVRHQIRCFEEVIALGMEMYDRYETSKKARESEKSTDTRHWVKDH